MNGVALWLVCLVAAGAEPAPFFVRVVDAQTGRGVPLVSLRTTNEIVYYTDSQGVAVVDEPGLVGAEVFLTIASPGYEYPADGFGNRGVRVVVAPGQHTVVKLPRVQRAERLYRITGGGIYRDSVLAGLTVPIAEPVLNGKVFGCDSVSTAVYAGKLYWFWGDTTRPSYPLGNFQTTGAVSDLPASGGLQPEVGVNLRYFTGTDGFVRGVAPMPGDGPTWIDAVTVLTDAAGRERMFAAYAKIKPPMEVYQRGLIEWDPVKQTFVKVCEFDPQAPVFPRGHVFSHTVDGVNYIYFANPYPLVRVPATPEALADPNQCEAYTCLSEGSRLETPKFDRDATGRLRYAWRRGAPVIDARQQQQYEEQGLLKPDEGALQVRDAESGRRIVLHNGSVAFNPYRQRWVMIANELGGEASLLGEVWYTEAEEPTGPWSPAIHIATHPNYSFYNPQQHPQFAQENGRIVYFEGTYTSMFSGNQHPTPRYEYNQIMYRLDLGVLFQGE